MSPEEIAKWMLDKYLKPFMYYPGNDWMKDMKAEPLDKVIEEAREALECSEEECRSAIRFLHDAHRCTFPEPNRENVIEFLGSPRDFGIEFDPTPPCAKCGHNELSHRSYPEGRRIMCRHRDCACLGFVRENKRVTC